MSQNTPFGYNMSSVGKLTLNEPEAEITTFIWKQYMDYLKNPPEDLVKSIYKENYKLDSKYTMEMAIEEAKSSDLILNYVIMYSDRIAETQNSLNSIIEKN